MKYTEILALRNLTEQYAIWLMSRGYTNTSAQIAASMRYMDDDMKNIKKDGVVRKMVIDYETVELS